MDDGRQTRRLRGPALAGVAAILAAALMLVGCPEEYDEDELDPDRVDDGEVEMDVDTDDRFEDDETYSRPVYDGRRNPFRPDEELAEVDDTPDEDLDETGPTAPLEQHDLDSLQLVTIVSQQAVPRAMFVDPEGMGHFATEGDGIGRDGGVVEDIRSSEVEIREGSGEAATTVTVELRERQIRRPDDEDELTEEERRALQELLGEEEAEQALEEEQQQEEIDERLPGLQPPSEE